MDVLLLGPVQLRSERGQLLTVGGTRRWAVLATLALRLNEVVTVGELAASVWEGTPPPTARAALQGHVAALRKVLEHDLELTTANNGYRLVGDRSRVDVHRFDDLVRTAHLTRDDAAAATLLDRALALWGDTPLVSPAGVPLCPALAEAAAERRLRAFESLAERQLRLGRPDYSIPSLTLAVRAFGLRESLVRLLMLSLHQDGRRSEALELYERACEGLMAELATPPGPLLLDALARITSSRDGFGPSSAVDVPGFPAVATPSEEPTGSVAPVNESAKPQQLPRRPGGFVGRSREISGLDRALAAASRVVAVVGPAGVGKSSLTVGWARAIAHRFPAGQLFVDLKGFGEGEPLSADTVVIDFLYALGVRGVQVPSTPADRIELYRRLVAQRKLLVVLDNVRAAADVRALLPEGGASLVLLTSRSALSELELQDGARRFILAPLPPADAVELLKAVVGTSRVTAEVEAVHRWAELCDHLPLALRISASRLVLRPTWSVAQLVEELRDERTRLAGLDIVDGIGVRAAITVTCRLLPPGALRLFTLLGMLPADELDTCTAAALTGTGLSTARTALGVLAGLHMLEETRPGRFKRHNLLGIYARLLLAETVGAPEVDEAWRRLLNYCVAATYEGAGSLAPYQWLLEPAIAPSAGLPHALGDGTNAVGWFHRHEPMVRTVLYEALRREENDGARRLSQNVYMFYYLAGSPDLWVQVCEAGLAAAVACQSATATAHARSALGLALIYAGRPQEGVAHLERARDLRMEVPHARDLLVTHTRLGVGYIEAGAPQERAMDALTVAVGLADGLLDTRSKSLALYHLSRSLATAGKLDEALEHADASLALLSGAPDKERVWAVLLRAQLLLRLGRGEQALLPASEATAVLRRLGYTSREPEGHWLVAEVLVLLDRAEEAVPHLHEAVALLRQAGSQRLAEAQEQLAHLLRNTSCERPSSS